MTATTYATNDLQIPVQKVFLVWIYVHGRVEEEAQWPRGKQGYLKLSFININISEHLLL